jgi:major membrane immunogen (membrane-anchored lipoprotein)
MRTYENFTPSITVEVEDGRVVNAYADWSDSWQGTVEAPSGDVTYNSKASNAQAACNVVDEVADLTAGQIVAAIMDHSS